MSEPTEFISRDAAVKAIEELIRVRSNDWVSDSSGERRGLMAALCAIYNVGAEDIEPVTQCKDCKYFNTYQGKGMFCTRVVGAEYPRKEEDFCSYVCKKEIS